MTMTESPSICIEDFCGYVSPGHFPITFSADWFPSENLCYFTGDWGYVPNMPTNTEPTTDDVWKWAQSHGWSI